MPFVEVQTAFGVVKVHYCISTPENDDAAHVDTALPTILFLHPVCGTMQTFHPQFGDPAIRRFNLVGVDLLAHGLTEGAVPGDLYRQTDAAALVASFMDALELPPCVVVGLDLGTMVGTQLAVSYPAKVVALFLVSPLGTKEPEEVIDGKRQVVAAWRESFSEGVIAEEAVSDTIFGFLQFAYNNCELPPRCEALTNILYNTVLAKVAHGPEDFDQYEAGTFGLCIGRVDYTSDELSRLRETPVMLVICSDNIAYRPEYVQQFETQLSEAGVSTQVETVLGAPHFGIVTHHHIINPMIVKFVLQSWKGPEVPPANDFVISPFEEQMLEVLRAGRGSDEESSHDHFWDLEVG